jgi:CO/xanthine dehydrogenase Mo-binding subunit
LDLAEGIFEVSKVDLVVENGGVALVGAPASNISFAEIIRRSPQAPKLIEPPSIEATHNFNAPKITYAWGTHVVALEVDAETGHVEILKYALSHDCGRVINPMIVEGQIHGGIACGIGNALLEQHVYDDNGQLSTGSFMDYAMPGAVDVPDMVIVHQETPSKLNPLGVKGVGEAGTIPVPAVIANAVEDALAPLEIPIRQYPLTPATIWQLINRGVAA